MLTKIQNITGYDKTIILILNMYISIFYIEMSISPLYKIFYLEAAFTSKIFNFNLIVRILFVV